MTSATPTPRLAEPAFVLAGGLGTRLRSVLPDRPKVLAPIADEAAGAAGLTFLDILLGQLSALGFRRVVLLVGSRHEQVAAHVAATRGALPLEITLSIEPEPLGTGGALKHAAPLVDGRFVLLNGDTYFDFDAAALIAAHAASGALVTFGAARVADAGRYGRLAVDDGGRVRAFHEKEQEQEKESSGVAGLINAGVYVVERALLEHIPAGRAVSLEREVFPSLLAAGVALAALPQTGAFFDIGTPDSYRDFIEFRRRRAGGAAARDELPGGG